MIKRLLRLRSYHHRRKKKRNSMIPSRAGFTIIEVLIVTLISALLAGVLFSSFWQTQRLEQIIDDLVTDDQTITRLYNQFEKDVNGFFVPTVNLPKAPAPPVLQPPAAPGQKSPVPAPQVSPAAEKEKEQQKITKIFVSNSKNKMLSLFTFTSNNVLSVYNKQKPLVSRVVYRLEPSKKFEGTFMLTRQELNELDAKAMEEKNKQTQAYLIADSIDSLVLTYVYEETQGPPKPNAPPPTTKPETKKVTEWDSDAITNNKESKQPLIPDKIEMQLTLRNATDGTTNQFTFIFPILVVEGIAELFAPKPPPMPPVPPQPPTPPAGAKAGQQAQGKQPPQVGGLPQPKSTVVIMGAKV